MSTRFSQWRNTEYVGLPVESYLQAGLVKDQRIETELQKTSAALAEYKSLQAVGANAEAYQNEIMSGIKGELEALAKENLKSPEALMKMQSIVSNPTYVTGLKNIAKNTEYFKLAQKAAKDYEKESGNKINATPFYKAYQELMSESGDPTKFNANRFAGLDSIPKYTEIQKEINDVVAKMNASKRAWDASKGAYIQINSVEELGPKKIQEAVQYEFRNRKDLQAQLARNIDYDSYSTGVSTEARGEQIRLNYEKAYNTTTSQLDEYKKNPAAFIQKYKLGDAKRAEQQIMALQNQQQNYDQLRKLDPGTLVRKELIDNSAYAAGVTFGYIKEDIKKTTDSSVLQQRSFAHQEEMRQRDIKLAAGETAMVNMGAVMNPDASAMESKIKNGDYINEMAAAAGVDPTKYNPSFVNKALAAVGVGGIKGGMISLLGGTTPNNTKDLVKDIAKKYGYVKGVSSHENEEAFLKDLYQSGNYMPTGFQNANLDPAKVIKSINSAKGGAVYIDNVLVTDKEEKAGFINLLNNGDNKSKIKLGDTQLATFHLRPDGITVASFRHPDTNALISYEVNDQMFADIAQITKAKYNNDFVKETYTKPMSVKVSRFFDTQGPGGPYDEYTAAQVKDGTGNITYFKDARSPVVQAKGRDAIVEVARVLAHNDLSTYTEAQRVDFYNKAIKIINDNYNKSFVKNKQGVLSLDDGVFGRTIQLNDKNNKLVDVVLPANLYIINNKLEFEDDMSGDNFAVGLNRPLDVRMGKSMLKVGGNESEFMVNQKLFKDRLNRMVDMSKINSSKYVIDTQSDVYSESGVDQ